MTTNYSQYLANDHFCVFLFHGVISETWHAVRNYTRKHISLDRFKEVINDLCSSGNPVSMPDIVNACRGNAALPKKAFAITFDDGFENNYSIAVPVLEELHVPAAFYVTTGFVENNSTSWIDQVESAVASVESFRLDLNQPQLGAVISGVQEKILVLDAIRDLIKNDASLDPYRFAEQICEKIGIGELETDPELDQMMEWHQVATLHKHPLFTIGGHSHSHRILEFLTQADLEDEINRSMDMLAARLGTSVAHYSYPEGLPHCYSNRVIDCLKKRNVQCCPTAEEGVNDCGDDLFRLKRIMVV